MDDNKYVTFKRAELAELLQEISSIPFTQMERMDGIELKDAVVIRRQDLFASPCLLTYSSMISLVATNNPDKSTRDELLDIADYFHRQGILAGEEGYKLPTI